MQTTQVTVPKSRRAMNESLLKLRAVNLNFGHMHTLLNSRSAPGVMPELDDTLGVMLRHGIFVHRFNFSRKKAL